MKKIEIYVHIPFCVSKCAYCDFYSMPMEEQIRTDYIRAVIKQIEGEAPKHREYEVSSVYFGGGTPSSVMPQQLMIILDVLRRNYTFMDNAEITVECNPGTITRAGLMTYREHGVNRISFGLQSANDEELLLLGRIHDFATFCESYQTARMTGFNNINVDLISSIPGQNYDSFKKTLQKVVMFKPEHISVYSLILEEGTPLCERQKMGLNPPLPDEDEERRIYKMTGEILVKNGYFQYEISNYARPGMECRHNIGYWDRTEYFGYGVSAASLLGNRRFTVEKNIEKYIRNPLAAYTDEELLSEQDAMSEFMFLGLRMNQGVSISDFRNRFSRQLVNVFGAVINKYIESGHLLMNDERIFLSDKGRDVCNYIFSDFLL